MMPKLLKLMILPLERDICTSSEKLIKISNEIT